MRNPNKNSAGGLGVLGDLSALTEINSRRFGPGVQILFFLRLVVALCVAFLFGEKGARADTACGLTDQTWVNVKFVGRGWTKKLSDADVALARRIDEVAAG